jgi:hypothetical protein
MPESAVSPKTFNTRMSIDMSGPLSDMPNDTTLDAQVANTCLLTGECLNETPILFQVSITPLTYWPDCPQSCLCDLTAQPKAELLFDVPSNANCSRAPISALRSLDVWMV